MAAVEAGCFLVCSRVAVLAFERTVTLPALWLAEDLLVRTVSLSSCRCHLLGGVSAPRAAPLFHAGQIPVGGVAGVEISR